MEVKEVFEGREGLVDGRIPTEPGLHRSELIERGRHRAVVLDEKVSGAQELLKLRSVLWDRPLPNSMHFSQVHLNLPWREDETQKRHRGLMKL